MRRVIAGLAIGILLGSAAQGAEREVEKLVEGEVAAISGATFAIPEGYGPLVNVVVSSEVHHLYFQDGAGVIRIVLVGQRAAASRARAALHLLSPSVYRIDRDSGGPS
jgi:hypothetical protein